MSYQAVVRTRTTNVDYFWVGQEPEEWWTSGWGRGLLRLRPCLLREAQESGGRIFLSAVRSGRRDAVGTYIRYEILLVPSPDGPLSDDSIRTLLQSWWGDRGKGSSETWELGRALDIALSDEASRRQDSVDALIRARDADVMSQCLAEAVSQQAHSVSADGEPVPADFHGWVGANWSGTNRLLASGQGLAYFASIGAEEHADALDLPRGVILVVDGDDALHAVPKVMARRSRAPSGERTRRSRPKNLQTLQVSLITIGVILLILLLLRMMLR